MPTKEQIREWHETWEWLINGLYRTIVVLGIMGVYLLKAEFVTTERLHAHENSAKQNLAAYAKVQAESMESVKATQSVLRGDVRVLSTEIAHLTDGLKEIKEGIRDLTKRP